MGLGFVLDGDGIACIDLDGCLTDGVLAPWARRIVERAPGAFVEVSVSGRGLHIWGYASVPHGRVVATPDGGKAEIYGWGRYIAVTGNAFEGSPAVLGNLNDLVAELTT